MLHTYNCNVDIYQYVFMCFSQKTKQSMQTAPSVHTSFRPTTALRTTQHSNLRPPDEKIRPRYVKYTQ